jgi:hypothetical protein
MMPRPNWLPPNDLSKAGKLLRNPFTELEAKFVIETVQTAVQVEFSEQI